MENSARLIAFNCRYSHSCLALFYIRAALKTHLPDWQPTIRQFTVNDPYYDTLLKISGDGAPLFIPVYVWNSDLVERLVRDLGRLRPGRIIVLGGPQAPVLTDLPENCCVVSGPIEGVGEEFYRDLAAGSMRHRYRAQAGREFPCPYEDEDFSGELQNRQVYYESSRGCPFRCSYCLSSVDKQVVHKDIDLVLAELEYILRHQPMIIKFVDRTFNDQPERAMAIWRFLADQPGTTRFHFEIAPDRLTDEMLSFLETVSLDRFQFEIGVQSTDPATLNAINRSMDVAAAMANIARLAALDTIHLHVDLILGLPGDTVESFRASFNRVFQMQPHYIQMGLLKVLPDTPIRERSDTFSVIHCARPPYEVLATRDLDHAALHDLHGLGECVEEFYNNRWFRTIWSYLRRNHEEPFIFFQDLHILRQTHYPDLAPTQKLLCRILHDLALNRADRGLFVELLRFDWLRTGHRLLPDFLNDGSGRALRDRLWERLPQEVEGLYTTRQRSRFFKRAVFLKLSAAALRETGLAADDRSAVVCLLPEQTRTVLKTNRATLLEDV